MTMITSDIITAIVKTGGSRYLIQKLSAEETTKKIGIPCIKLLFNIATLKSDALMLLKNQKATQCLMKFLSKNSNDKEVNELGKPLLKLFIEIDDSDYEFDIQEIIKHLKKICPSDIDFHNNLLDNLEMLDTYCLIPKNIEILIKFDIVDIINEIIQKEIEKNLINLEDLNLQTKIFAVSFNLMNKIFMCKETILNDQFLNNFINSIFSKNQNQNLTGSLMELFVIF